MEANICPKKRWRTEAETHRSTPRKFDSLAAIYDRGRVEAETSTFSQVYIDVHSLGYSCLNMWNSKAELSCIAD